MVIDEAQRKRFVDTIVEEGNKLLKTKKSTENILDNKLSNDKEVVTEKKPAKPLAKDDNNIEEEEEAVEEEKEEENVKEKLEQK